MYRYKGLVKRCFPKHKTDFTTVGIFWDLELRSSLTLSPRRRPGINNKTPSLCFFSSAQAQGSPKDPRARLLPSSPEPFEMVWNPGASQSATSSSQLPGGSAAGCRHGQPSEPHQLGSKPAPRTPGETQAARTQGSLTCHHRSKAVETAILRCGSLISPSSFTDCPPPELTPAP